MDRLYAPWRSAYVKEKKSVDAPCPFCLAVASVRDEDHLILARYDGVIVLMNKFPYNNGHLLIIPCDHKADLSDVSSVVRGAMINAAAEWSGILKQKLRCQGVNVGINLGVVSGGSIPDHLHMHVVPRWPGDTNFLATIGEVKLISNDIAEVYRTLRA